MEPNAVRSLFGAAALLLLLSLALRFSAGGYLTLRLTVCSASLCGYMFWFERTRIAGWTFVLIGILYNPLLPVRLARATWQPIDLIVGIWFVVFSCVGLPKLKAKSTGASEITSPT